MRVDLLPSAHRASRAAPSRLHLCSARSGVWVQSEEHRYRNRRCLWGRFALKYFRCEPKVRHAFDRFLVKTVAKGLPNAEVTRESVCSNGCYKQNLTLDTGFTRFVGIFWWPSSGKTWAGNMAATARCTESERRLSHNDILRLHQQRMADGGTRSSGLGSVHRGWRTAASGHRRVGDPREPTRSMSASSVSVDPWARVLGTRPDYFDASDRTKPSLETSNILHHGVPQYNHDQDDPL